MATENDIFAQEFQSYKIEQENLKRDKIESEASRFSDRVASEPPTSKTSTGKITDVSNKEEPSLFSFLSAAAENMNTLHGITTSDDETILDKMGKSFKEEMSGSVSDFFMGNVAVEESILKTPTMDRKTVDDLYSKGKLTEPMRAHFYSNYGTYRETMPDEEAQLKAGEDLRGVIQGNKDRWQAGVDKFKRGDEYLATEKSIPEEIAGAIGSSVFPIATTAVNPVLGFAANYNISKGNQYGELKNKIKAEFPNLPEGDVIDKADIASSYSGGVVAGLETLSDMVKLRGVLKATGFKKWLLRAAESSFGEGITEFAQQYPEEFATVWALNPDLSKKEILEFIGKDPEAFKRALHAGGIGAAVGGIMGGGVAGLQGFVSPKQAKINEERTAKAKEVDNTIDNLAAKDSKVDEETAKLNTIKEAEKQGTIDPKAPKTVADIPVAPERTRVKESVMASPKMSDDEKAYTVDLLDNLALASVKKGWAPDVETWYKNWYSSIEYADSIAKVQEVAAEETTTTQAEEKLNPLSQRLGIDAYANNLGTTRLGLINEALKANGSEKVAEKFEDLSYEEASQVLEYAKQKSTPKEGPAPQAEAQPKTKEAPKAEAKVNLKDGGWHFIPKGVPIDPGFEIKMDMTPKKDANGNVIPSKGDGAYVRWLGKPEAEAQPTAKPKTAKPKMYATTDGKKYASKEDAQDHQVWLDNQEKAKQEAAPLTREEKKISNEILKSMRERDKTRPLTQEEQMFKEAERADAARSVGTPVPPQTTSTKEIKAFSPEWNAMLLKQMEGKIERVVGGFRVIQDDTLHGNIGEAAKYYNDLQSGKIKPHDPRDTIGRVKSSMVDELAVGKILHGDGIPKAAPKAEESIEDDTVRTEREKLLDKREEVRAKIYEIQRTKQTKAEIKKLLELKNARVEGDKKSNDAFLKYRDKLSKKYGMTELVSELDNLDKQISEEKAAPKEAAPATKKSIDDHITRLDTNIKSMEDTFAYINKVISDPAKVKTKDVKVNERLTLKKNYFENLAGEAEKARRELEQAKKDLQRQQKNMSGAEEGSPRYLAEKERLDKAQAKVDKAQKAVDKKINDSMIEYIETSIDLAKNSKALLEEIKSGKKDKTYFTKEIQKLETKLNSLNDKIVKIEDEKSEKINEYVKENDIGKEGRVDFNEVRSKETKDNKAINRIRDRYNDKIRNLQKPITDSIAIMKGFLSEVYGEKTEGYANRLLYQTVDKKQQGYAENLFIDGAPKIITMLESHDVSTLVHESGHIMLAAMHANKDTDFATAAEFVGADPRTAPKDWAPAQHEKIAKAWEMYLREGKTAIPALKNLFEKFKTFLTAVYKTVVGNDFIGPDGKQITLTPEVRQMFEGWLSAESRYNIDGLRDAAAKLGMNTKGMTDAQVEAAYEGAKAQRDSVRTAKQQLVEIAGMDDSELITEGDQSRVWGKDKKRTLFSALGYLKAKIGDRVIDVPKEGTINLLRPLTGRLGKIGNKLFQTRTIDPEAETVAMEKILSDDLATDGIELPKHNINLRKLNSTEDANRIINTIAESYRGKINEQRRGVITEKQMNELADSLGLTPEKLMETLPGTAQNAEYLLAARTLLVKSAQRVADLATGIADKASVALKSPAEILEFRKALRQHAAVQAHVQGMIAEAGRALRSFQILRGSEDFMVSQLLDEIETQPMSENDVMEIAKDITDRVEKTNDGKFKIKETNAAVARSQHKKAGNMFISMFINNLISNPLTHIANFSSNLATGLETISENLVAASIKPLTKAMDAINKGPFKVRSELNKNATYLNQDITFDAVGQQALGWVEGWKDAFTAVAGVMPDFVRGQGIQTQTKKFQTEDIVFKNPLARKTWEYFMTPANLLELGDIIFTQGVNQRSNLYYHAKMKSLEMAKSEGLNDAQTAELYSRMIADPAAYKIDTAVKEDSEYQTFRQRMGETGNRVAGVLNSLRFLRLIVPFMRTPTNITKFAVERTPILNFLSGKWRDDWFAGGARRSQAVARLSIGSAATAVVLNFAAQGLITGGGPEDKDERRQWFEDGYQPYSIKINDEWYSYKRLEPISSIIGFVANAYEMHKDVDENGWKNITSTLVSVFAEQLTDATYFQGISDMVAVLREPERYSENWISKMGTKLLPWSSGQAYIRRNIDDTRREVKDQSIGRGEEKPTITSALEREVDSLFNSIRNTIPGLSKNLPPKLNFWAEPVPTNPNWLSPFQSTKFKDDPVINNLLENDISFSMPEKTANIMGVKVPLSPEEYNVYVELMNKYGGEEMDGLKNVLKDVMDSESYNDVETTKDEKRAMLAKEVNRAKKIARSQLYESVESVKKFVDEQLEKK